MTKRIFTGIITSLFLLTVFSALAVAQPKKAKKLVSEGDKFLKQKNYQSAVNKYAEAIVLAPNYPDARFSKGKAHFYLNQFDESIEDLSAALAQGYKKPLDIYSLRWNLYYQKKDYDAALNDLRQAIKLDPSNASYNRSLGDIYLGKEQWRDALTAYKASIQPNQSDPDLYYFIAFSHYKLGETSEQEIAASEAVKRGTKYLGETYFLNGESFKKNRKFDDAIKSYQNAISTKPDLYDAYINLSDLYRDQNRFREAVETVNKGLALYPEDGTLYINLSWYNSLSDRHQEAVNAGLKAVKFAPKDSMGYTNLCRAYNDTKQYQLAIQACNTALSLNPGDGETNFYLGRAHDFLNKSETAAKYYDKAVDGLVALTNSDPNNSDSFYLLGNAYAVNGQRVKAIEAYRRCLLLSPRFAKARYNLGYIYFLNGNTTAAREQYEELRRIDPATAERLKQAMDKK